MDTLYDVVIVGGGPAGLTAALYLARASCRVLVLEKEQAGGQIAITEEVVNYPGIQRINGRELAERMKAQAEAFGAVFQMAEATGFDLSGGVKTVRTSRGDYRCLGLLLATGASPRSVGFQGEETYRGRGVAYCATCDGEFFTGKDILVVGGGYAAAEESVFLTRYARHVTILIRRGDFSCAASVAAQAKNHPKITVLTNTVLEEVSGENGLTYARWKNTATGEMTELRSPTGESFGVFVLAGRAPATGLLRGVVELDEQGYIVTDTSQRTSAEGVFAAGDVCAKALRQVVTATGDGATAAASLEKYVADRRRSSPQSTPAPAVKANSAPAADDSLLSADLREQLNAIFSKMEHPLSLRLYLDRRPGSSELEQFITELTGLSNKLSAQVMDRDAPSEAAPYVSICRADGTETDLAFHGVPGGHEFTTFALSLYNAAGPGQPLDEAIRQRIAAIDSPTELMLLVTLSCSMCPELVIAAQHIAAVNPKVSAHVYDIRHFEALRQRYQVMSVPCLVINGDRVHFGRKSMEQLLSLLEV